MVIGDHVSREDKKTLVRAQLTPWTVLYFFCHFPRHHPRPSNNKYLLIASALGANLIALYISSHIAPLVATTPARLQCQVTLPHGSCGFLSLESYLDCSDFLRLDTEYTIEKLVDEMWRIKGRITDTAIRMATVKAVGSAITLPDLVQQRILQALRA